MSSRPVTYPEADLTHQIIGAFYDVYNKLGTGFREIVYQRAMTIALTDKGLRVDSEVLVPVMFHGRPVGGYWPDLVIEQRVVAELKTVSALERAHYTQVLNALRAKALTVGLLLNFGPTPQVKRFIMSHRSRK
jgi:GxxExxY protein